VTLSDLRIAADNAVFGQARPKVGSVDPGWGTAYLGHVAGEKRSFNAATEHIRGIGNLGLQAVSLFYLNRYRPGGRT